MTEFRKKLIEVALPLDAINEGSKPETENPFLKGHPRAIHNWWARTPLSVCRAILFAQLVDDPGAGLDATRAEGARAPLLDLIRRLCSWDATTDALMIDEARDIIDRQFDGKPPAVWDMFAGRGSISIEAQRLGLSVYSSDLNPVAVTIQKALLQYPQKFAGAPPVNPQSQNEKSKGFHWHGRAAEGLMEDIAHYGGWMREQAVDRIGHLYPKVRLPDGPEAAVIAWLWARTVASPNPAVKGAHVPLVSSFVLSSKKGREVIVVPQVETGSNYRFVVKVAGITPDELANAKSGTKVSQGSFRCALSGAPIPYSYVDDEANAGRMRARLMAIVAKGNRRRIYHSPNSDQEGIARSADPVFKPREPARGTFASNAQGRIYGFTTFGDYFTDRQLVALTTFSDLVSEARNQVVCDAQASGLDHEHALLYADAIATYLACALSRMTDYHCALSTWNPH